MSRCSGLADVTLIVYYLNLLRDRSSSLNHQACQSEEGPGELRIASDLEEASPIRNMNNTLEAINNYN